MYFNIDVNAETLEILGSGDKRWTWVHVDDLGDAYVLAAQRGGALVGGQIYNIGSPRDHYTYRELRTALARSAGWKGSNVIEQPVVDPNHKFASWEVSIVITGAKATNELGWQPRHIGFLAEIDRYYRAWSRNRETPA